jgi:hypothetical protein
VRDFQNISKSERAGLSIISADVLNALSGAPLESHRKFSISVFDHWLAKEECISEIDNVTHSIEKDRNHRLHEFCVALAKSDECYLVKLRGRRKEQMTSRVFTSEEGMVRTLKPVEHNVGDNWRFVLSFPKLKAIYLEGSDFTHHVCHQSAQSKAAISALADDHGLFVLNDI